MFAGGINDVVHPDSHKLVISLSTMELVMEIYFNDSEEMNDKYSLSFEYEIYAEGCQSVHGEVEIPSVDIKTNFLG